MIWRENELTPQTLRYYPKAQNTQGASRPGLRALDISPQTPYRLDNCHCAGRAKDSYEQQVALHRRKTTTKACEQGKRDQVP